MTKLLTAEQLTAILRDTIVGTVRRDSPDLSARQFAIMLICYIEHGPHTVRGLAGRLEISKPSVTRSLDRLAEMGLARRADDPSDGRSVLIQRTRAGTGLMAAVCNLLTEASRKQFPSTAPSRSHVSRGSRTTLT